MAAAMFLIVAGSGLRGRGTLEECGPDVALRCNNVVGKDACVDRLDEEKGWDEQEESNVVMVRCVWGAEGARRRLELSGVRMPSIPGFLARRSLLD